MRFTVLNSKEIKAVVEQINEQWASDFDLKGYVVLRNEHDKIFISNHDVFSLDFSKLGVNAVGLYLCEINKGIRLSIEGSQLIGPFAKKNVVELDDDEMNLWFRGEDFEKECHDCSGFVILKHGSDYLGSGKYREGTILNFCPKTRRINPASKESQAETEN